MNNINLSEVFSNKKLITVFSDISNFSTITQNNAEIFRNIASDEICLVFNNEKYSVNNETINGVSIYLVDSNSTVVQVLNGKTSAIINNLQQQINELNNTIEQLKQK